MSKLRKFTLSYNDKKQNWDLKNDQTNRRIQDFNTKKIATAGGILKSAVGKNGGSVKIQKMDGKYEEERTYPRSKDPKSSKG